MMDRREFFKLAGLGAGALLSKPELELYELLNKPVPEEPEVPKVKQIQYEAGYIYRGAEQVCAIANCNIEMNRDTIEITTSNDLPYRTFWPGKLEVIISGDLTMLVDNTTEWELFNSEELLHCVVSGPDKSFTVEADGLIVSINTMAQIDHPLVSSFEFRVSGEAFINENIN